MITFPDNDIDYNSKYMMTNSDDDSGGSMIKNRLMTMIFTCGVVGGDDNGVGDKKDAFPRYNDAFKQIGDDSNCKKHANDDGTGINFIKKMHFKIR